VWSLATWANVARQGAKGIGTTWPSGGERAAGTVAKIGRVCLAREKRRRPNGGMSDRRTNHAGHSRMAPEVLPGECRRVK